MSVVLNAFKGALGKVPISGALARAGGRLERVRALSRVTNAAHDFAFTPQAGKTPLQNMATYYGHQSALAEVGAGASASLGDMTRFALGRMGSHAAVGAGIGAGLNAGQHLMFGDQYGNRSGGGAFRAAVRGGIFGATMGAGVGAGRMAFGRSSGYMEHLAARARAVPKIAQTSRANVVDAAREWGGAVRSHFGG